MPRMLRPKMVVLPESALAAEPTHEAAGRQPYFLVQGDQETGDDPPPDGHLAKGDKVALVERGRGPLCRVRDAQGRLLATPFAGLNKLP